MQLNYYSFKSVNNYFIHVSIQNKRVGVEFIENSVLLRNQIINFLAFGFAYHCLGNKFMNNDVFFTVVPLKYDVSFAVYLFKHIFETYLITNEDLLLNELGLVVVIGDVYF